MFDVGTNYVIKGGRLDGCTARVVATDLLFRSGKTCLAVLARRGPVETFMRAYEDGTFPFHPGARLVRMPAVTHDYRWVFGNGGYSSAFTKIFPAAEIGSSQGYLKTIYHDGLVHAVEFIPHPSGNE